MASHDLLRSTVTNQIVFDQRDSKLISNFERAMDRCCQAQSPVFSGFHIGNLDRLHISAGLCGFLLYLTGQLDFDGDPQSPFP